MAVAKSYAVSLLGLSGTLVEVEADISSNLPNFVLVGLPDASLSEATARVRAATANSGLPLPARRITVNLSPAAVPKHGSAFDLAIAMTVLAAAGAVSASSVEAWVHIGELGLNGALRPVRGILPMLLEGRRLGFTRFVVPLANSAEAQLVDGLEIFAASHISQVAVKHGAAIEPLESEAPTPDALSLRPQSTAQNLEPDIADVHGQEDAVWAMTVAAAGGHHVWLHGPPGAGKTMLAERLATILPPLSLNQSLETSALQSLAGKAIDSSALMRQPPFEAPHHGASMSSLIGGGHSLPRPGAISLAHHGVLFLDEAPEFQASVLDSLRQPLESGEVVIHRAAGAARFPSRFQLILASNPCPCGNFGVKGKVCDCAPMVRSRYANKLSGPLLDRVDIRLAVQPASAAKIALSKRGATKTSQALRTEVIAARARASERWIQTPWRLNSEMPGTVLREHASGSKPALVGLISALERGRISMRGFDRCLRLAWTVADLDAAESLTPEHVAKALYLRGVDA